MDALGDIPLEEVFVRFDDALVFLRARTPMPAEQFYALDDQARLKAFTVSNAGQMSMVQQVLDSLDKAVETGQDLGAWKAEIGPALEAAWAGSVERPAFRLELIYRNATQQAFSHGRVRQMRDPAVTALRPYWLYDAVNDSRTSDICSARDGVLLPADDPWWARNTPPGHHACRSGIRSLRKSQADRRGGVNPPDREVELNPPGKGFGAAPSLDPSVQVAPYVPDVKGHPALEGARLRKEREFQAAEEERRRREAPHRPEHWVAEFRAKGYPESVAQRLAHGKAAEERGLDRQLDEMVAIAERLRDEGDALPIWQQIRWVHGESAATSLRAHIAATPDEQFLWRSYAAILEHADSADSADAGDEPLRLQGRPAAGSLEIDQFDRTVAFYRHFSDKRIRHPSGYKITTWTAPRARVRNGLEEFELSPGNSPGTFVHEWAHSIEHLNPSVLARSIAYRDARTRGEPELNLSDLFPGHGYEADEVAKEDKFRSEYSGKVYRRRDRDGKRTGPEFATEILSMGLEEMIDDSESLRAEDEDTFWFCLGQLSGP